MQIYFLYDLSESKSDLSLIRDGVLSQNVSTRDRIYADFCVYCMIVNFSFDDDALNHLIHEKSH